MGLGGMKYAWQRQTKDFGHTQADKYSCLVYDNRGIGDSDKPRSRYSTSEMAKDIIEVIDHLGWNNQRQLHVIGISMGGMIAQEIVSRTLVSYIKPCAAPGPSNFIKQHKRQRRSRYAGLGRCSFRCNRLPETGRDKQQILTCRSSSTSLPLTGVPDLRPAPPRPHTFPHDMSREVPGAKLRTPREQPD